MTKVDVKLRDHPLLTYHGISSWPPVWVFLWPPERGERGTAYIKGEVGVLKEVRRWDLRENKCFLYIDHERSTYLGCLLMEDPAFCWQLYELLKSCSGRSIKEIGDMDVSHTL